MGGRTRESWNAQDRGMDVTKVFVWFAAGPLLLPLLGVGLEDLAFAIPALVLPYAAARCAAAAKRSPDRRLMWGAFALANLVVGAASILAVAIAIFGGNDAAGFYLGLTASVFVLFAALRLVRGTVRDAGLSPLVDAILTGLLIASIGTYFVAAPGFLHGDPLLTLVFVIDLAAAVLAVGTVVARHSPGDRRVAGWIAVACLVVTVGDGLVSAAAAGQLAVSAIVVALLWAAVGGALAAAAGAELSGSAGDDRQAGEPERDGLVYGRVLLPLAAVLIVPGIAAALWLMQGPDAWTLAYFGVVFALVLVLAFGRQAYLLIDNQRAVARERRLRGQVMRRNEELEALTSLATTMTQTLEEAPILERGLGVLHLAARATSSALHSGSNGTLDLLAASGAWQAEQAWAKRAGGTGEPPPVESRGRRQIVRLPLATRGSRLGAVTLIRPDSDPLRDDELPLLKLLADQLAIALQNARDYREKLELSIRDPLTGLYNRRYFYEALEKEVRRSERYGAPVSLVLVDIDGFKQINDALGHGAGDDVLRRIAETAEELIRPSDSFARVGGEEFGLLLPETKQLDALLAAERLRSAVARLEILPGRRVTVSAGISSCPEDGRTLEELEQKADTALYWSKRNGKNLCAVASEVIAASGDDERERSLAHLYGVVETIDAHGLHPGAHSANVASYSVALGQLLGLDRERVARLRRAALLHDIGKTSVPAEILAKPGPLTQEEWEQVRRHPAIGAAMLAHAGFDEEAAWVRHHHERIDGTGYPDGLAGDEIPLEARILCVAACFEAMTSQRPYRDGMRIVDAVAELRSAAGTQFDARVVEALTGLVEQRELPVLAEKR
jgi:diguanylate cyclase (GGDEF)-like protein/putative nucleotidyltransferase with HDIG domain